MRYRKWFSPSVWSVFNLDPNFRMRRDVPIRVLLCRQWSD